MSDKFSNHDPKHLPCMGTVCREVGAAWLFSVLIIGDSNTEIGHIVNGMNDIFRSRYGEPGSGYVSLNEEKLGTVEPPVISVSNDDGWKRFDMFDKVRLPPPYPAPDGNWVESSRSGAVTTVDFTGAGLDIYWLAQPGGGPLRLEIDGKEQSVVSTEGEGRTVRKSSLSCAQQGKHCASLTSLGGKVTLLGADAVSVSPQRRAVCHKWGNGWSSTLDFLNIEETVFAGGLQSLNPDVVVLLHGSNDHNIDGSAPDVFKSRLIELIRRIRNALPGSDFLLASTLEVDSAATRRLLPAYLSTSYPEAASETGVEYWDLSTWFGPFDPARMLPGDSNHLNAESGRAIAAELFKQLTSRFPKSTSP